MISSWLQAIQQIVGSDNVLTHPKALLTYAQDGYTLASGLPEAVVLPASHDEVCQVVRVLGAANVPMVARGAGTGLSGGAVASPGAVILHFSRMRRIYQIDWVNRVIEVDPGVINRDVTRAAQPGGFFYAPDPSSQQACTIGGNFAENSGGPHCLKYGVTVNHVLMADVVLPTGDTRRFGTLSGEPDGPDWLGVLVGSEGTLGIATRLWLRLTPLPEASQTLLALFDSVHEASRAVSEIIAAGIIPAAMEMMDTLAIAAVEKGTYPVGYPDGTAAVLLIEIDGPSAQVALEAAHTQALLQHRRVNAVRRASSPAERDLWWANRKTAFGAMGLLSPRYYVQDGVIPRHSLPQALARIQEISREYDIRIANVFHAGDGNLHPLLLYNDADFAEVDRVMKAGSEILAHCVQAKGSITGEHGVGLEKLREMTLQYSLDDLAAQRVLKSVFDPLERFNPGKLIPTPGQCIDYATS